MAPPLFLLVYFTLMTITVNNPQEVVTLIAGCVILKLLRNF